MEEQLDKLRQVADKSKVNVAASITELEQKLQKARNDIYSNLSGWQKVQLSRHPERPYTLDYISMLCDDFIELHGDRMVNDDKAIVGGLGSIDSHTVMFIGHRSEERRVGQGCVSRCSSRWSP